MQSLPTLQLPSWGLGFHNHSQNWKKNPEKPQTSICHKWVFNQHPTFSLIRPVFNNINPLTKRLQETNLAANERTSILRHNHGRKAFRRYEEENGTYLWLLYLGIKGHRTNTMRAKHWPPLAKASEYKLQTLKSFHRFSSSPSTQPLSFCTNQRSGLMTPEFGFVLNFAQTRVLKSCVQIKPWALTSWTWSNFSLSYTFSHQPEQRKAKKTDWRYLYHSEALNLGWA